MMGRLAAFAAFLAVAALAGPAAFLSPPAAEAARPSVERFHVEDSFDIDCGSFLLHEDLVVDVTEILFFDEHGNPDRLSAHVNLVGVITSPSGETFRDPGHFSVFIDLAGTPEDETDDTVAQAGLVFNVVVPGLGSIAQDTGLIIFGPGGEVTIHGPHEVFEQGESLLCSALA